MMKKYNIIIKIYNTEELFHKKYLIKILYFIENYYIGHKFYKLLFIFIKE